MGWGGGRVWCGQPGAVGAHSPSRIPALGRFRYSGRTAVPQFLTQHSVSAAGGLPEPYANETSSEALTAEARGGGQKGVQRSQGWWKGWIGCPKNKCTGLLCSSVLQQLHKVCFISQSEDLNSVCAVVV